MPEHHGHVLTKLFGRKKKITWAYFSDFIKEHFSGPKKDDADISVEAEINANDEEELLVFYQSDLLQAALMPEIVTETRVPLLAEGGKRKLKAGAVTETREISDVVTLKELVEILGMFGFVLVSLLLYLSNH